MPKTNTRNWDYIEEEWLNPKETETTFFFFLQASRKANSFLHVREVRDAEIAEQNDNTS